MALGIVATLGIVRKAVRPTPGPNPFLYRHMQIGHLMSAVVDTYK